MEKITLEELRNNKNWDKAVIVFTEDSFERYYSEDSRSYRISSKAKYFNSDMIGTSLFGDCLDGTDQGVRLDIFLKGKNPWKIEYCYIETLKEEKKMSKQKSAKKPEVKSEVKKVEKMKEPKKAKKISNSQKVTMIAFSGMKIGEFDVIRATSEKITVNTEKNGLMEFDAKTGIQTDAANERFANRIVLE